MSGVMEEAERLYELGLNSVPDKSVCSRHFLDKSLKRFIRKEGTEGTCDYCGKDRLVVPLEDMMERIMTAVLNFHTDPGNFMGFDSSEGGYLDRSNVYDGHEVVFDVMDLEVDDDVRDDILESIDVCQAYSNEYKYHNTEGDYLSFGWEKFKNLIKHKVRYFFMPVIKKHDRDAADDPGAVPLDILQELGKRIIRYKLIEILPVGTKVIRCRQHDSSTSITSAEEICSPPDEYAQANRHSPQGISMFYCAFDEGTALAETIDKDCVTKTNYTSAIFTLKKPMYVVNFCKLRPWITQWDIENVKHYYAVNFLHSFVRDISQPISRNGKEHLDYVPTQVVSEFIRYGLQAMLKRKIELSGLIYPSAKMKSSKSCVLFLDHKDSLKKLAFDPKNLSQGTV